VLMEKSGELGHGRTMGVRGSTVEALGCFIGAARSRARSRASLGVGARCRVPRACSGASARVEHVDVCSAPVQTPIGRISSRIWARLPCRICSPD
jgi:hypothetical protein